MPPLSQLFFRFNETKLSLIGMVTKEVTLLVKPFLIFDNNISDFLNSDLSGVTFI